MNNQNYHPTQAVPPVAHALHHWDEQTGVLRYEYNGLDIITIETQRGEEIGFRHGSDGSMQSLQYMQQIYLSAQTPQTAVITLTLGAGSMNLRPRRAGRGQAVLGQLGCPLLEGINGMYDPDWDLLLDWHGCRWHWLGEHIEIGTDGRARAKFEVEFSQKAMFLNLRPHYYRTHLGYSLHEPWRFRPNPKPVSGWCSWEAYRRDINIDKVGEVSAFLSRTLKPYGLEYIQVDDGYQKMPLPYRPEGTAAEGWLTCEESKFPGGHTSIVQSITQNGFAPAVWTNANLTNPAFPALHPQDIIWHDGKPLKGEWIDYLYSCTPECLAKHVEPLFAQFRALGYRYVKIDAIRHLLFDGLHECVRLGSMSNEEASACFRRYMESTRKGLGEDVYYLASWGELHEVIGVADACRISMDANPTWAGIRMQLFESARWYHTQRVLFLNDPDHVCVRTNAEWAKSVLSLISLSGELYMLSDTVDAYTPEKLEIIRRTLPPLATKTAETGPLSLDYPAYTWTKLHGFAVQSHETPVEAEDMPLSEALDMAGDFPGREDDHPFSSLWAFHLTGAQGSWCVMARIATLPLRASRVELDSLGLSPTREYLAFDFWNNHFLGVVRQGVDCDALPLGHCSILALHPLQKKPQIIASDRHVSMDAVSILEYDYNSDSMRLRLAGIPKESTRYYLHLPQGFAITTVNAQGAQAVHSAENSLVVLVVQFEQETAAITIQFTGGQQNE